MFSTATRMSDSQVPEQTAQVQSVMGQGTTATLCQQPAGVTEEDTVMPY